MGVGAEQGDSGPPVLGVAALKSKSICSPNTASYCNPTADEALPLTEMVVVPVSSPYATSIV